EIAEVAGHGLGLMRTERKEDPPDRAEQRLKSHFATQSLRGFGIEKAGGAVQAAAMVLDYAQSNGLKLGHVDSLSVYSVDGFMSLDPSTRRSLELTTNMMDGSRRYTLLGVLDYTCSPMGARLLRRWIEQPLIQAEEIRLRQGAVARLLEHGITRGDLRDRLKKLGDLERMVSRCSAGLAGPRDLAGLKRTLFEIPDLEDDLRKVALEKLQELRKRVGDHRDLAARLHQAVVDDPPLTTRDGGIIRPGFDVELDKLRSLQKDGRNYIAALETEERERTGIDRLKVGYNSVFGYYLEVPKNRLDKVPDHYIRKQTTAGAERYITAELKDHEAMVMGAEEKMVALEEQIFLRLREAVALEAAGLLQTARALAELDCLAALSEAAHRLGHSRPELVDEDVFEVVEGRHPVVEEQNRLFVPNDLTLGRERMMILTGPNMSGKSTFLRQTALIQLMAQIGAFVPARSARLGLCDRIFTRIGAKDELALGQSTFMVEMIESANILNNATRRSLVILDEVGRGTSTFDGLAIAWAMVEHLAGVGAKTLFATHYHQLNAIADRIPGVFNARVAVEERGDEVIWTHRVLRGGTDRSYGIQVARMAGLPSQVLLRAAEILGELESESGPQSVPSPSLQNVQLTLFEVEEPPMVRELKSMDLTRLTPMDALMKLDSWKKQVD
ncbi:MAG: DNA mismatch repair protein MutS, partial [Fimbriimonadaceae bacterium]|nr:DNA mismatch repair protein MutS [Fimbriimonadaceae bacterium]